MDSEFNKEKLKYTFILFIAVLLFVSALFTGNSLLDIPVIVIGAYLYKFATPILLKEYNERKNKRIEEGKVIQEALQKSSQLKMKENKK